MYEAAGGSRGSERQGEEGWGVVGIPCRHAAVTAWHEFPCAVQLHPDHLIMPVRGLRLAWLGAVVCARTPRVPACAALDMCARAYRFPVMLCIAPT